MRMRLQCLQRLQRLEGIGLDGMGELRGALLVQHVVNTHYFGRCRRAHFDCRGVGIVKLVVSVSGNPFLLLNVTDVWREMCQLYGIDQCAGFGDGGDWVGGHRKEPQAAVEGG